MELPSLSLSLGSADPQAKRRSIRASRRLPHLPVFYALIAGLFLLLSAHVVPSRALAEEIYPEGAVKAVMLYNLPDFTEWPATHLRESDTQIKACLLGKMRFQEHYKLFQGRKLKGRTLDITSIDSPEEVTACHLVFITPTNRKHLTSTLDALKGKAVLTISDTQGFASQGGMIELTTAARHIRLIINLGATKAAGIQLHSSLLDLATIFKSPTDTP